MRHQKILIVFVYGRISYNGPDSILIVLYILIREIVPYLRSFYKRKHVYINLRIFVGKTLLMKGSVKDSRYVDLIQYEQGASEIQTVIRIMVSTYHKYFSLFLGQFDQKIIQKPHRRLAWYGLIIHIPGNEHAVYGFFLCNMENLIRIYNLPVTMEEGLDFAEKREKMYFEKGVDLKPGAVKLLQYLKDRSYKIILATSSTRDRALGVLDQHGIRSYFDEMVFGTEVKRGKPNPDIFLKACEKAGEIPEHCLVLEDSEAGVQAGHAAGIDVICVPDMKMPGEEFRKMAAYIPDSLEQVIPWLENRTITEDR